MTTKFNMIRDINGYNGFGIPFADDKYSATIAQNVAQVLSVPSNFKNWLAIFCIEPGSRVWIANNHDATVPVGASFAATNSELNVPAKYVKSGDILSFITPDVTADVGVMFYALS
jgi:hypothetical protein